MLVIKGTKQKKVHPHFNIKIEYKEDKKSK